MNLTLLNIIITQELLLKKITVTTNHYSHKIEI